MVLLKRLVRWCGEGLVFERLDVLTEFLEDDEIAVDDRVQQTVGQVVGSHFSDASLTRAQSVADWFKDVAFLLLEGEDEVVAQDDADLLGDHSVIDVVPSQHSYDNMKVTAIVFGLRTLVRVEDVFLHERGSGSCTPMTLIQVTVAVSRKG